MVRSGCPGYDKVRTDYVDFEVYEEEDGAGVEFGGILIRACDVMGVMTL